MSDQQKSLAKRLVGITLGALVLAIGLWAIPGPGIADASGAADHQTLTTEDGVFEVFANIPVDEIKTGQFCQGYANIYNGTPPYDITWSGQFTNADAGPGPLDDEQIVNGYVDESAQYLTLEVIDSTPDTATHTAFLNIDDNNDFNDDCGA
ncbi:MAG: hypothetical protein U5R14_11665 [Gemmatimonadota bacterium]|nr:hypothetical protein [Gemmatimonadota bacterium]